MTRAARIRREVWATGDAASELRQAEFDLDRIDLEVAGLRTIRVARSRDVLHDLGFDVDDYTPLPLPRPTQQRSTAHPDEFQLAQAIAQRRVAAHDSRAIRRTRRSVRPRR